MEKIIGLDTSIFIYFFENNPRYADQAERYFTQLYNKKVTAVFAGIGLIELLTGPNKTGNLILGVRYRNFILSLQNLTIAPLSETVIELAAQLRAINNIRTPDAIHLATAIEFGADTFITNDKYLAKVKEIDVTVI